MAAESVMVTQATLGLLSSGVLQLLKKSSLVKAFNDNSKVLNHLFLLATSAGGAIGIHAVWSVSAHSLTITGLDFWTIMLSLWLWIKQWSVQFLVHKGAFGPVSEPPKV